MEEEVSSSQAHIAELTAILRSAVRSNGTSQAGHVGNQSPRSAALSREESSLEAGPRLRSKELQGELLRYNNHNNNLQAFQLIVGQVPTRCA